MDIAHKTPYKQILPAIIGSAGLCCITPGSMADVTFDGTVGPAGTLSGPTMEITADRGQMAGNNLFHSFSEFNVNTGQTANFSGPDNVQNIFGRVTGSNPSTIDGIISSSIPGANLFLMNPNGMMFGPNAQINISGSFHATTADYLSFGNQERFYADINQNTTLSVAAPSAFGFLNDSVSYLTVDGSQLNVTDGNSIIISAGDIEITNAASVSAPDGKINISSVKSAGEIPTNAHQTDFDSFSELGSININNASTVSATGAYGGRIVIRGGKLTVDAASVSADTEIYATQMEPNIEIETRDSVTVANSGMISADLKLLGDGTPTGITITTDSLNILEFSSIQSLADFLSFGNAGNIEVHATHIMLDNYSHISTSTSSTGNSGDISILNAETLDITNASSLSSAADWLFGEGESGNIQIEANYITIEGLENPFDPDIMEFTGIDAGFSIINPNNTGDIIIKTKDMTMSNIAQIRTSTAGNFSSGNIEVDSENILIDSGSSISTSATDGTSGSISIDNKHDFILEGISINPSQITGNYSTSTVATNGGGDSSIVINSGSIQILNGAKVISQSKFSEIPSGDIQLNASSIEISGINEKLYNAAISKGRSIDDARSEAQSEIRASASSNAISSVNNSRAGSIDITSEELLITDNAAVKAEAVGVANSIITGDSGNIVISSSNIRLENAELSTKAEQTNGGNIVINSNNGVKVVGSTITSLVESEDGNGGNIDISSDLMVINKSRIIATAVQGNGGNININSNALVLTNDNVIDASSELSIDGEIAINSKFDIQNSMEVLPTSGNDASKYFSDNCIQQNESIYSSLLINNHWTSNIPRLEARSASEYHTTIATEIKSEKSHLLVNSSLYEQILKNYLLSYDFYCQGKFVKKI